MEDRGRSTSATGEPGGAERLAWATATPRATRATGTSSSDGIEPQLTLLGRDGEPVAVDLPRFDEGRPRAACVRRGVPSPAARRPPRDDGLRPAARPVRRRPPRPAGRVAGGLRRPAPPYTPAWQERHHRRRPARRRRARRARVRAQRRGHRGPVDDLHGRGHQPLVPLRPDLPHVPDAAVALRLRGPQRRRLGALRRPGEGAPADGLADARLRPRLERGHRATSRARRGSTSPPTSGATSASGPTTSPRRWRAGCSRGKHVADSTRSARGSAGCRRTRASTATRSTSSTRPSGPASTPATHVVDELREGRLRFACEDPDAPENFPRVLTVWRANLLGRRARATSTSCEHLLGSDGSTTCAPTETPPELRPARCASGARRPRAASSTCSTTIDFRMTSNAHVLRRRAAGRHLVREERPLLHRPAPVRALLQRGHRRRPGRRSPTGTPSAASPRSSRGSRRRHLGVRRDLVAAPLAHDTPDELAQPFGEVRDWRAGECEPVPGKTMPEADSWSSATTAPRPREAGRASARWSRRSALGAKGGVLEPARGDRLARRRRTASCAAAPADGRPSLERVEHACEAILALSGTTNGRLALEGFRSLERRTGVPLADLAEARARRPDHAGRTPRRSRAR